MIPIYPIGVSGHIIYPYGVYVKKNDTYFQNKKSFFIAIRYKREKNSEFTEIRKYISCHES
jgi:hypothetical protein